MKSKRVLIVEDNDLNRMLFENLIGQLFSFTSAKNGLEAVDLAETQEFDLILMDIQMPKMDGITAMKKIRQGHNPACPILAVTAYAEESDRHNFLEQGFDDFVTKPIRPREFLQLVQSYLKGSGKKAQPAQKEEEGKIILDKNVVEQLLKYNSKAAIQKVLEDFLEECKETEQQVLMYETNPESKNLIEKIHNLKGNSGTLGAQRIYFSAQKAEELWRKERFQEFSEELKNLKNEIRQFRDFLNQETIFDS
mgnify:CR=1 FL=1